MDRKLAHLYAIQIQAKQCQTMILMKATPKAVIVNCG